MKLLSVDTVQVRRELLPESTYKSIEILSKNKKEFFLMVEGSQIDCVGYANYADTLIDETLDFDKAVGVALDFAKNDRHTGLINADHGTGGVTIVDGEIATHKVRLNFSTKDHNTAYILFRKLILLKVYNGTNF